MSKFLIIGIMLGTLFYFLTPKATEMLKEKLHHHSVFKVGECFESDLNDKDAESWVQDHVEVFKVLQVGKKHYRVRITFRENQVYDTFSLNGADREFSAVDDDTKIECPSILEKEK